MENTNTAPNICLVIDVTKIPDELFQDLINDGKLDLNNYNQIEETLEILDENDEEHQFCIEFLGLFLSAVDAFVKAFAAFECDGEYRNPYILFKYDLQGIHSSYEKKAKKVISSTTELKELLYDYGFIDCYDYIYFDGEEWNEDCGLEVICIHRKEFVANTIGNNALPEHAI